MSKDDEYKGHFEEVPKSKGGRRSNGEVKQAKQNRGPGRRFQPGISGNPGGRPARLKEIRELGEQMSPSVMLSLHEINQDPKQPGIARVAAAREILDRTYGKAPLTQLNLNVDGGESVNGDASGVSALLMRARLEQSKRKLVTDKTNGHDPNRE
jgi:hypothetical protein